jgi:hypothetical protein
MKPTTSKSAASKKPPTDTELAPILGRTAARWHELVAHVEETCAPVKRKWTFSKTTGHWFLRLIRKQRTLVYLLVRGGHFVTAFVFGEKATAAIRASGLPQAVIAELNAARVYAEGRGIRLVTRTGRDVATMKKLVAIKLAN